MPTGYSNPYASPKPPTMPTMPTTPSVGQVRPGGAGPVGANPPGGATPPPGPELPQGQPADVTKQFNQLMAMYQQLMGMIQQQPLPASLGAYSTSPLYANYLPETQKMYEQFMEQQRQINALYDPNLGANQLQQLQDLYRPPVRRNQFEFFQGMT